MSKLTEALNARGMHNDYEFFGEQPYAYFDSGMTGLAAIGHPSGWRVQAHKKRWYFNAKKSERERIQRGMTEKFGIVEFTRSPFGGWGDADFIKTRTKELLALPPK